MRSPSRMTALGWLSWPVRLAHLALWFTGQMLVSNARVTRDVLTRVDQSSPIIAEVRLRSHREREIALVALLVSLTPGTLVIAVRRTGADVSLYVHSMYADRSRLTREVAALERRVVAAARPRCGGDA